MSNKLQVSRLVLLALVMSAIGLSSGTRRGSSQAQPQPTAIDLSGTWKLDSAPDNPIVIDHLIASGTVIARFSPPVPCHSDRRTTLLDSRLKIVSTRGADPKITLEDGKFFACTRDKKLIDSCSGITAVWASKFRNATVSADGNTITGERFHEWIDYEEESGRYVNCRRNTSKDSWSTFTLTRACEPDQAERCRSLGNAIRTIEKLIPPAINVTPGDTVPLPMPTVTFDPAGWQQKLAQHKPALAAELDELSKQFCDDASARDTINAQKAILDVINPGTAQTTAAVMAEMLRVSAIDFELKVLATRSCAVSGPPSTQSPPPGICNGVPAKQPGDNVEIDKMLDHIKKSMDKAIKMAEKYERDAQGGAGTTAGQYADYYRTEAEKWRKLKGFWDNIRAATCVPREVIDLLRAVQGGRTDMCTRLCQKTADWIAKMYPGSQGDIQKQAFFIICSANCPD